MRTFAVKGLFAIAVVSLAFPAAVFAVDESAQLTQVELTYGQVSGVELDNDVAVFRRQQQRGAQTIIWAVELRQKDWRQPHLLLQFHQLYQLRSFVL